MEDKAERKVVEREQDDAERERKGQGQTAKDPKEEEDPRGEQPPPQPFSGPSR